MALKLRTLATLSEDIDSVLNTHMSASSSKLPIIPVPEDPMLSSGLFRYCMYTGCLYTDTYI